MGLLDDAIREHLELKRRHGADPSEVARQEREALGAGRIPPAPSADADAGAAPVAAADAAPPTEVAEPGEVPTALHEHVPAPRAGGAPPDAPSEPSREPDDDDVDDVEPPEPVEPLDAPPPERGGAVSMSRTAPDEPELDWSDPLPLDEPEASEEPVEEDVLEETPEFLQETPEHDRLWFEQRPPKDFDF